MPPGRGRPGSPEEREISVLVSVRSFSASSRETSLREARRSAHFNSRIAAASASAATAQIHPISIFLFAPYFRSFRLNAETPAAVIRTRIATEAPADSAGRSISRFASNIA